MANEKLIDQSLDFQSISSIFNLPAPAAGSASPARQVDLEAAIEGVKYKSDVAVAAQGNINIASPGATIDSYTPTSGNRDTGSVLLYNQTDAKENGIWIWNGASSAMTRAVDANSSAELTNATVSVLNGTDAGNTFRQTTTAPAIGTNNIQWVIFGGGVAQATESLAGKAEIATQTETDTGTDDARIVTPLKLATWSGRKRKGTATIGDGSATQFDITHNFGSRDVVFRVWEVSGSYRERTPSASLPDTNTLRLNFATAPSSNSLKVTVIG